MPDWLLNAYSCVEIPFWQVQSWFDLMTKWRLAKFKLHNSKWRWFINLHENFWNSIWPPTQNFKKIQFAYSNLIASFKLVIFMTHMHNLPKFSFFWTKYVIFTIFWKFCYRWLRLYYSKSTNKLSVLLPALVTHVYGSSITKISENRKYDVFCSKKWKFG